MKIIEKDFNVITGEETITERNMTAEEFAQYETAQTLEAERIAAEAAKAAEKAALLDRLGITQEEAQLLLGGN
jgi:predicted Ser/Thr protein kinase